MPNGAAPPPAYHNHEVDGTDKKDHQVFRHDHAFGAMPHDHKKDKDSQKDVKPSESKDEPVESYDALPPPAGYDELGQPLATQQERMEARTETQSRKLAEKIGDFVPDPPDKSTPEGKAYEAGVKRDEALDERRRKAAGSAPKPDITRAEGDKPPHTHTIKAEGK